MDLLEVIPLTNFPAGRGVECVFIEIDSRIFPEDVVNFSRNFGGWHLFEGWLLVKMEIGALGVDFLKTKRLFRDFSHFMKNYLCVRGENGL